MDLNLSFQEKTFYLLPNLKIKGHLFLIFDQNKNQITRFRLTIKNPPSLVDKTRTLFYLIKALSVEQNSNSFTLNDDIREFFSPSENLEKFVIKYKNKIIINNNFIIDNLIEFFLKEPIPAWNNLPYSEAFQENEKIKAKEVIEIYNLTLNKPTVLEQKKHPFLKLDFDFIKKNYSNDKDTLEIQKEKIQFFIDLTQLEILQAEYLKRNSNNSKLLDSYFYTFSMLEKTFFESNSCERNLNISILPNKEHFSCIILNAGISVSKNRTFYVSFLKVIYFFLFCLGIDLSDVFLVKKSDLLQIDKIEDLATITFFLNEKVITRTISANTKQFFILLKKDIETIYFSDFIFTKAKQQKNIKLQSLRFLVNRDLEGICENIKIQKITAETLHFSAIIYLRLTYSAEYVMQEYKISKSFLNRIENFYEIYIL